MPVRETKHEAMSKFKFGENNVNAWQMKQYGSVVVQGQPASEKINNDPKFFSPQPDCTIKKSNLTKHSIPAASPTQSPKFNSNSKIGPGMINVGIKEILYPPAV